MNITDIRIQRIRNPKGKLLGFAEIILDGKLVIKDFQIFTSNRGLFVGMPSRKMPDGSWREMVFSIDTELSETLKNSILRAFEDEANRPENL
ncbi:MAG: septation regulator SpoVG [Candidatus Rifleibacteriota bacterium]